MQPKLSICIPTYNAGKYLSGLIDELLKSPRSDFEIVVSDDCSSDGTWDYLKQKSLVDHRLKCFRNANNLGMDANFAKAASLADGDYIWFCGQDDKIFHEGVAAVLTLLEKNPELSFVFLNHEKVTEAKGEEISQNDMCTHGEHDVYGNGLEEFLSHNSHDLPTFLPKYILKRSLWESVDVTKYFGTYYCQVGVFLEVAENLKWCHLDGNYVVGLTPINGWQSDSDKFTKISLGLCEMFSRVNQDGRKLNPKTLRKIVNKNYKRLIMSFLLIKNNSAQADQNTINTVIDLIRISPPLIAMIKIIMILPSWMAGIVLNLNSYRRVMRKSLMGLHHQGPNFE